jgi:hypothetical protein
MDVIRNSKIARCSIGTFISKSLDSDDYLNRSDDGGSSDLTGSRTEGSLLPPISPISLPSPWGCPYGTRRRSAVLSAFHSRDPILVRHHPLILFRYGAIIPIGGTTAIRFFSPRTPCSVGRTRDKYTEPQVYCYLTSWRRYAPVVTQTSCLISIFFK